MSSQHSAHPTHIVHGTHELLIGRLHGLFLCVCLGCGHLLGAAKHLHILGLVDRLHTCRGL